MEVYRSRQADLAFEWILLMNNGFITIEMLIKENAYWLETKNILITTTTKGLNTILQSNKN